MILAAAAVCTQYERWSHNFFLPPSPSLLECCVVVSAAQYPRKEGGNDSGCFHPFPVNYAI